MVILAIELFIPTIKEDEMMNGKKAKRLRREAESMTIGMPSIAVIRGEPPVFKAIVNPKTLVTVGIDKIVVGVPQLLSIGCTRFVYKKLKQNFKSRC